MSPRVFQTENDLISQYNTELQQDDFHLDPYISFYSNYISIAKIAYNFSESFNPNL